MKQDMEVIYRTNIVHVEYRGFKYRREESSSYKKPIWERFGEGSSTTIIREQWVIDVLEEAYKEAVDDR